MSTNNGQYQKITAASQTTGLSQNYLRLGCRAGTIPHIRIGKTYYVHVSALLTQLEARDTTSSSKS